MDEPVKEVERLIKDSIAEGEELLNKLKGKRGRPVGYKRSAEEVAKMLETRKKNRELKNNETVY